MFFMSKASRARNAEEDTRARRSKRERATTGNDSTVYNRVLWYGAGQNDLCRMEELLSEGICSPDWRYVNGSTALLEAASNNHWVMCRRLMASCWSSTARDDHGDTPLRHMAQHPAAMDVHFMVK